MKNSPPLVLLLLLSQWVKISRKSYFDIPPHSPPKIIPNSDPAPVFKAAYPGLGPFTCVSFSHTLGKWIDLKL